MQQAALGNFERFNVLKKEFTEEVGMFGDADAAERERYVSRREEMKRVIAEESQERSLFQKRQWEAYEQAVKERQSGARNK